MHVHVCGHMHVCGHKRIAIYPQWAPTHGYVPTHGYACHLGLAFHERVPLTNPDYDNDSTGRLSTSKLPAQNNTRRRRRTFAVRHYWVGCRPHARRQSWMVHKLCRQPP